MPVLARRRSWPIKPGRTARLWAISFALSFFAAISFPSFAAAQVPPTIILQPASKTVNAGTTVFFQVVSGGGPGNSFQWQVSIGGGAFSDIPGATSSVYIINSPVASQSGLYQVVVSNAFGTVTSDPATLTVVSAPVVTSSPTNATVSAGSNVSFVAAATGDPAPTVQWQVSTDGGATFNNIAGATATTLTFAVAAGQNGNQYRAVFTNAAGTATTTAATLTVPAPPSMVANPGTTPQNALVSTAFANPLAVTVKDAGNNPLSGVNVTFTAPGAGASGTFSNLTNTITIATNASGIASAPFTANATAGGPYTVTAASPGLTTVNFSLTNAAKAASAVTVASSLNPSTAGQTVTFTATVTGSAPTGLVTFKDGTATLGTGTLSGGQATFSTSALSFGSHSITAVYGGDANNNGATSSALLQSVNTPADSLRLRALQLLVAPMEAQVSGQAISNAVDSAISEGFSSGGAFVTPSANGVRFNFAADAESPVSNRASQAGDPFNGPAGSLSQDGRATGSRTSSSRVDDAFNALAYAAPTKAPPLRAAEPREWLGWAEVRGATLDHWGSATVFPGVGPTTNVLYGNQVNALAGLTHKLTPNFLIGVLGGYETFDYRSDALQGRLKGDGWTAGAYLGWKISQNVRLDTAVAYSGIGYNGTAGSAAGSFSGDRLLVSGGLTGTYRAYGLEIEPSARVYALWEHENAYTDTLGTLQTARDFSTGRASGGVKVTYPTKWSDRVFIAPYAGLYGDYYFNSDTAGAIVPGAIPTGLIMQGWSARASGGLLASLNSGALIAVGAERSGIGGNFAF